MTNREWLMEQMQNMSDEEFATRVVLPEEAFCGICLGNCNACVNAECVVDWLKAEHKEKIKLSNAERVILESVDKKYKWIARDNYNIIYFCRSEPRKSGNEWQCDNGGMALSIFNHLFQFIKWEDEQAYEISELLKGE